MKRTRAALLWTLGALSAACVALGLTGCRQDTVKPEDLIAQGYVHTVTFDLAGGLMGGLSQDQSLYTQQVRDNSILVEPGSIDQTGSRPTREGYTFNAYYRGTLDEDGNIVYGERWDFKTDRVTSDMTLYAKWFENYRLIVHYGENYGETVTLSVSMDSEGVAGSVAAVGISSHYTVIDCFTSQAAAEAAAEGGHAADAAGVVTFPYTPEGLVPNEQITCELWANALTGRWQVMRSVDNWRVSAGTNVYLLADLDFGGEELSLPSSYSGTFEGNGYTIRNFSIRQIQESRTEVNFGLFRALTRNAVIRNVTFENMEYVGEINNPRGSGYEVGIFAGSIADPVTDNSESGEGPTTRRAVIENVKVTGTFTFTFTFSGDAVDSLEIGTIAGYTPSGETYDCDTSGVKVIETRAPAGE